MKVVEIFWKDAFSDYGNLHMKAIDGIRPVPASTVGYLLQEDDECVKICATVFSTSPALEETAYSGVWVVPRGMIEKIVVMRE